MNIDPATGLDLDDPKSALIASGALPPPQAAPPSFAPPPPAQSPAPAPMPAPPSAPAPRPSSLPLASPELMPPSLAGNAGSAKSVTDRESTTSTQRQVVGKDERQAQADYQKTLGDQAKVIKDAGAIDQERARAEQEAAQRKEELLQQHQEKFKGIIDNANTEYARAEAKAKESEAAYKAAKPEGLFADDKTGLRRFFAGVALMLGGYNAGRFGGENTGFQMIKEAIDRKDRMERERIGRLKEGADEDRNRLSVVLGKKHEAMGDLAAWKAGAWEQAAGQLQTRLAAQGVPAAQVQTDARVLQAKAEAQKEREEFLKGTRTTITNQVQTKTQQIVGGGAGAQQPVKPYNQWSEPEKKAEGLARRAYKANEDMDRAAYTPKDLEVLRNDALRQQSFGKISEAAAQKLLGSTLQRLSPEGKKRFLATKEFIISALRQESGAVIGPTEIADAEQRYGSQAGDTRDLAAQKRSYRMNKIMEVGMQTGDAERWMKQTGQAPGQTPGAPAQAGKTTPDADRGRPFRHPDGRMGRLLANGTFIPDPSQQVAAR